MTRGAHGAATTVLLMARGTHSATHVVRQLKFISKNVDVLDGDLSNACTIKLVAWVHCLNVEHSVQHTWWATTKGHKQQC